MMKVCPMTLTRMQAAVAASCSWKVTMHPVSHQQAANTNPLDSKTVCRKSRHQKIEEKEHSSEYRLFDITYSSQAVYSTMLFPTFYIAIMVLL